MIEAAHQTASFERRDWWRGTGQRGKAKKGRQIGVNITGARRIVSTRVGSDRLRKFSTSPDSSIAYQERVLTLTDRLCPDLTMELLQFYYSQIARGRVRALPGAPSGTGQRREWHSMCCLSCCRRNQRSLAKEIRCVSLDLPQTVQKPSRPVLKITRWVLIGCENPLLYSILCALSRKGVLTRFASF